MASLFAARPALATAARPLAPATAASAVPLRAPAARRVQAKALKPLPRGMASTPAAPRRPMLARPLVVPSPVPSSPIAAKASLASADGSNDKLLGVEKKTLVKVMALGAMFFSILFNYTILRDTKDVLVVTAPGSGAEVIPFLKTWVNLPMAIGFTVLYAKLANVLSTENLFYACIIPFIAFFAAFAFVLYPARGALHPTALCDQLVAAAPRLSAPIAILRNWTYCLFYVMAELWGSVVVSVLFWGFANQITTVDEAKTFYPFFGLGANVALIFSGRAVKYFSQIRAGLPAGVDGWGVSLRGMMSLVVGFGVVITGIYWWLNRSVVPGIEAAASAGAAKKAKGGKNKMKENMSVGDSFKFLASSPYIRDLATLVVAYGISINLVEVTWKSKLKAAFPNPNDYSAFMGDFSSSTGAVTFMMMIASRFIFRRFGWGGAAIITPTVLLATGVAFFALVLGGDAFSPVLAKYGLTPLMAAVFVGAAQNVFSKSAKYSLFDPCKEMAYIPLDREMQLKGKAAIDVVCNPLGKSGGSAIQQVLIIAFGSLASSTPYLAVVLLGIVLLWLKAAASLDKQFAALQEEQQLTKLAEAREDAASASGASKKFKWVSSINAQTGLMEGSYVPLADGESVTASMDVVEAASAEEAAAKRKSA